jgi:hypothetical protein
MVSSPATQRQHGDGRGGRAAALGVGGALALAMLLFAAAGARRAEPPTFEPTPLTPRPPATGLVGPDTFTVDASDAGRWRFFSFAHGTLLERPAPADWDIAFRRFQVIANGGPGFSGDGGIIDLGSVPFDSVLHAPRDGYVANTVRSDTVNNAIRRWYDYSFLSHLLAPSSHVYVVRTADGRFAKLQFLGYYCPGARPGCVTFRYVYQGAAGSAWFGEAPR